MIFFFFFSHTQQAKSILFNLVLLFRPRNPSLFIANSLLDRPFRNRRCPPACRLSPRASPPPRRAAMSFTSPPRLLARLAASPPTPRSRTAAIRSAPTRSRCAPASTAVRFGPLSTLALRDGPLKVAVVIGSEPYAGRRYHHHRLARGRRQSGLRHADAPLVDAPRLKTKPSTLNTSNISYYYYQSCQSLSPMSSLSSCFSSSPGAPP
jgi:hypothetical protein